MLGHNVLAYVGERVSRSKTPVVDALLVLYPACSCGAYPSSSAGLLRAGAQTAQRQGRAAASALSVQQVV